MSFFSSGIEPAVLAAAQNMAAKAGSAPETLESVLTDILRTVRVHLGLEMAFISEFIGNRRVFRYLDADESSLGILKVGDGNSLEESYCARVVDGRLPELIHDATALAEACRLPVTTALPVGAHISVPIRFHNGELFGTFCCFSRKPDSTLTHHDLNMLRAFAELAGRFLEVITSSSRIYDASKKRIEHVLEASDFSIMYQPIYQVEGDSLRVTGYESLARFHAAPYRSPDKWFAEAEAVGLSYQLESAAIKKALAGLNKLPKNAYLGINASPTTILESADLVSFVGGAPERIVLELTEHRSIEDYAEVASILAPLRRKGVRLAVDDAGAGYASFRHILQLKPDIIKLDRSLISGIEHSQDKLALAAAIVTFAQTTGANIIAEGVETESELAVLKSLNVFMMQGYLLGLPASAENIVQ